MLRIITILLVTILVPICAFAGPPVLTDDTGTPGAGKWEINVGFSGEKNSTQSHYVVHMVDLNYGLGEHIQLKYEVPWVFLNDKEEGSKNGLGNSTAGLKWRFLDEDKHGVAMSVYPQVEFNNPTSSADRGIVDKGTTLILPFQVEKKLGSVNVNGELGYLFRQRGGNGWLYGLVFGYKIKENLEGLLEFHGNADKDFQRNEVVCDLGFRWDFSEKYGLQASAGRSFHHASDQPNFIFYIGLQFRI